jgi:hypothetical protein
LNLEIRQINEESQEIKPEDLANLDQKKVRDVSPNTRANYERDIANYYSSFKETSMNTRKETFTSPIGFQKNRSSSGLPATSERREMISPNPKYGTQFPIEASQQPTGYTQFRQYQGESSNTDKYFEHMKANQRTPSPNPKPQVGQRKKIPEKSSKKKSKKKSNRKNKSPQRIAQESSQETRTRKPSPVKPSPTKALSLNEKASNFLEREKGLLGRSLHSPVHSPLTNPQKFTLYIEHHQSQTPCNYLKSNSENIVQVTSTTTMKLPPVYYKFHNLVESNSPQMITNMVNNIVYNINLNRDNLIVIYGNKDTGKQKLKNIILT